MVAAENRERLEEELMAVSSIYEQPVFSVKENEEKKTSAIIEATPNLENKVTLLGGEKGERDS